MAPVASSSPGAGDGLLLRIPEMDCLAEEAQIRRALDAFAGIRTLRFDLAARMLAVDAPQASWPGIEQAIRQTGFHVDTVSAPPDAADTAHDQRRAAMRLLCALGVAFIAESIHFLAPHTLLWKGIGMALAAAAIALSGASVYRKGLASLAHARLNIDALMTVAVSGAFLIGQWPEAAMVMALYSLAELIEARSVERAHHAIASLLAISPPQAEVRVATDRWELRPAKEIPPGSIVRVKPGERFALDGRVIAGHGAVDQSPVTGESVPVDKEPGDDVFAGTINQSGSLEFEVTRPVGDTVLARIIEAVERAQGKRAPTQRLVDRFAAVYTPLVFSLALTVAVAGPWLFDWSWHSAIYRALVLLVIACPCALVISTPVTVVSALAAAARRGILIKGGVHLEQARELTVVAMDKTGTVTEGRPSLVAHAVLAKEAAAQRRSPAQVLAIAHGLAARSDHPVSQAIAAGLDSESTIVTGFAARVGHGVSGRIDGEEFVLGNHRWIEERGQCSAQLEARLREHEELGRTVTILADARGPLALFAVADRIRESSRQAVAELEAAGLRVVMLTGDNAVTARSIADQAGIDEVHAELLPQDKLDRIEQLSAGARVAMVGDGINDAPALSAAHLGFGMGGAGSDTALEAADVLVMNDDLRKIPETIRLSQRTWAILWQNITLALGIKLVFLVLALFDQATMWMAVFADMGASLLVVFNGLRLLGHRPASRPR